MFSHLRKGKCALALLGSAILAFGIYHVHSLSGVTEGGVLGMTLLLNHWFHISPAVSGMVLNIACYALGWRTLGKDFIGYSIVAGGGFSLFYAIFEQFPPLWPQLAQHPLVAALVGAMRRSARLALTSGAAMFLLCFALLGLMMAYVRRRQRAQEAALEDEEDATMDEE